MIDTLKKLQRDAWRTSGARYNASRRLRRREFFATVSFALMSALTVAVAFIQKVYAPPSTPIDNYLSTISASLGIFLLTLSLVEWGAKTGAMAETLHQNAEKLNTLWRKIELRVVAANGGASLGWDDIHTLLAEYDAVKAECRCNHEPIDDALFRIGHPSDFQNAPSALRTWIKWQISNIWYIAGLWCVLIVLALPLFTRNWSGDQSLQKIEGPRLGIPENTTPAWNLSPH